MSLFVSLGHAVYLLSTWLFGFVFTATEKFKLSIEADKHISKRSICEYFECPQTHWSKVFCALNFSSGSNLLRLKHLLNTMEKAARTCSFTLWFRLGLTIRLFSAYLHRLVLEKKTCCFGALWLEEEFLWQIIVDTFSTLNLWAET